MLLAGSGLIAAPTLGSKTLVIYNLNDPDSITLARYYAARRGIPDAQVLGLKCNPDAEEISRDEYDATIAEPLRTAFRVNNWWEVGDNHLSPAVVTKNRIRYVALIRGIPLKVREKTVYEGDKPDHSTPYGPVNGCSVDSEIAVLGKMTRQISGPLANPYYENYDRFDAVELPEYMLVCRLDGPTPDNVKRMVDESLRAESNGLFGWVMLDQRGTDLPGYKIGDDWLKAAGQHFRKRGFPIFTDSVEAILPTGLPMPRTALYLGWYNSDIAGAFIGTGVRFVPGAIACHIHSFSASTLRSRSVGWCGPLISSGADAVLGNVYEPYLTLTSNLDVFTERLLRGYTLAESAWASLRTMSWMNVVIGDPLYRPYAVFNNPDASYGSEFEKYHQSSQNNMFDFSTGFMAEAWAQRRLAEGDDQAADFLFQQALKKYKETDNLARTAWSYSQFLLARNHKPAAIAVLKEAESKIHGDSGSAFLLTRILELEPPKPAITPTATPLVNPSEPPALYQQR